MLHPRRGSGALSLLLYDITTLDFEAENEEESRKVGYSKERRIDPQIVVGLLVDRTGFPLEVDCFEGNTAETNTLVPIITAFAIPPRSRRYANGHRRRCRHALGIESLSTR